MILGVYVHPWCSGPRLESYIRLDAAVSSGTVKLLKSVIQPPALQLSHVQPTMTTTSVGRGGGPNRAGLIRVVHRNLHPQNSRPGQNMPLGYPWKTKQTFSTQMDRATSGFWQTIGRGLETTLKSLHKRLHRVVDVVMSSGEPLGGDDSDSHAAPWQPICHEKN